MTKELPYGNISLLERAPLLCFEGGGVAILTFDVSASEYFHIG